MMISRKYLHHLMHASSFKMFRFLLLVGFSSLVSAQICPDATLTITNGTLIGYCVGEVSYFLGVPYAQPPVGALRFKAPIPYQKSWTFPPRLAFFPKNGCPQLSDQGSVQWTEDCLNINVFTINTTKNAGLPVMVFIHGGDYVRGAAKDLKASYLANVARKGVVVVTFDYRLNVLGFMSGPLSSGITSNVGMLDQVQALRWVKAEIHNFGGDPNKVTLVGQGSGARAVSLHAFSPLSKGLFHRAIQQSGSGFMRKALFGGHNQFPTPSKRLAVSTGCINASQWDNNSFSTQFIACLQNISLSNLFTSATKIGSFDAFNWSPRIGTSEGFLPNWPRFLPRSSPVPMMIGSVANEDFLRDIASLVQGNQSPSNLYNPGQFQGTLAAISNVSIWGHFSPAVKEILSTAYAIPTPKSTSAWFSAISEMRNGFEYDAALLNDIEEALDSGIGSLFAYSFDYLSDAFPWPQESGLLYQGAYHGMDLNFLFNHTVNPGNANWTFSSSDAAMSDTMTTIWTNFVKTGNPNSPEPLALTWLPVTGSSVGYYSISEQPRMVVGLHSKANSVWNVQVPNITHAFGPTFPAYTGTGPTPYPLTPCQHTPCANGASCLNHGPEGYTCLCSRQWFGANCTLPACDVVVESSGAYILQATYASGTNGTRQVLLGAGVRVEFTALTGTMLDLHAIWGRRTQFQLTTQLCTRQLSFACSGTTYIGFQCTLNQL